MLRPAYFGQADGIATRVLMVFAFRLNQALVLSPPLNFVADSDYGNDVDLDDVHVAGYGYRWIGLRRRIGGLPWPRISSPGGSAA